MNLGYDNAQLNSPWMLRWKARASAEGKTWSNQKRQGRS
jgi:hypothetical protein